MNRALYVLSGPLIWLGSVALLAAVGATRCASPVFVIGVQLLAIAGCVVVLYRALSRTRRPVGSVTPRDRQLHFFAGGAAVLSMAGIGGGALVATLAVGC